jgi:dienelactone hydrolase
MKYFPWLWVLLSNLSLPNGVSAQPYDIGSATITFVDTARDNRAIETLIFYPATASGENRVMAQGSFPVIVFGHGFVMTPKAYRYLADSLVPEGYIVAFPNTETSFSPSHTSLSQDMAFLVKRLQLAGKTPNSIFNGRVGKKSAIMGHSMGGGCSFLACRENPLPTTMITFAAANTGPSAIDAAKEVKIPCLLLAGGNDCITPPEKQQLPMFEALGSACKVMVTLAGASHCFFADQNNLCSFGEKLCSPSPTISREQQHQRVMDLLRPYLAFYLKDQKDAWQSFMARLRNTSYYSCFTHCNESK